MCIRTLLWDVAERRFVISYLEDGSDKLAATSETNYESTLRNMPEERRSRMEAWNHAKHVYMCMCMDAEGTECFHHENCEKYCI